MQYNKLTKKELEEYGRTLGIELDRRKNKNTLIAEIKKAEKKKTSTNKNKTKKTNKRLVLGTQEGANKVNKGGVQVIPVKKKTKPTANKNCAMPTPKQPKSIIGRIRELFGL